MQLVGNFKFKQKLQAALAIHGFAICGFGYSHPILEEPNTVLAISGFSIHIQILFEPNLQIANNYSITTSLQVNYESTFCYV
jgi:hypothetical protein